MILSHRIFTATLIGLSGASVMYAMAIGRDDPGMAVMAGTGAFVAGLPMAGLFGRPGREGALAACAGAVMATGLGAGAAGLVLGLSAGLLGAVAAAPLVVFQAILTQPVVALTWIGSMAAVHGLTLLARGETTA